MSALLPVAVYGLKVPAGDVPIPALAGFPATFRLTMAAIDPSAEPEEAGTTTSSKPRATLKMVYDPAGPDDIDESEDDEDDSMEGILGKLLASRGADNGDEDEDEDDSMGGILGKLLASRSADNGEDDEDDDEDDDDEDEDEDDEDEDSDDEEEKNGGPSDPSKTKKARKQAALEELLASMDDNEDGEKDEMELDASPKVNGIVNATDKGKGKAIDTEIEDEGEDLGDELGGLGMEEVVICTLDPEKNYQQTLDITVPEDQNAYFKVSGTHTIYLTGNYVIPADSGDKRETLLDDDDEEDSEEDYDLEPDDLELDDDVSDDLDDLEDPRVTEVDSDEEMEAPKLVKKEESIKIVEPAKKGSNKRPAEDSEEEPANLDEIVAKSLKPESAVEEPKLSKKQLKKLKKNNGKAADVAADETKDAKANDKKVQFAKNLEAPPSASQPKVNGDTAAVKAKPGIKIVQGVKIDDKKIGKGPAAKNGNTVEMRYIGKLQDSKVFDANKSGKPFSFKLGKGEVIKGWDIGVAGMSAGGERRIIVPANLAYGKKSMPGIPSNSDLTFDLKLLAVK